MESSGKRNFSYRVGEISGSARGRVFHRGDRSSKSSESNQCDQFSATNSKAVAGASNRRGVSQSSRNFAWLGESTQRFAKHGTTRLKSHKPRMASYIDVEKIYNDMQEGQLLSGSSDLITNVQRYGFSARLNYLFNDVEARVKFLYVVVAAVSISQADVDYLRTEFLAEVLDSTIIRVLIDENVSPVAFRPQLCTPAHGELYDLMLRLLISGFEVLPTKMNNLMVCAQNFVVFLKMLSEKSVNSLSDTAKLQLEILDIIIQEHNNNVTRLNIDGANKNVRRGRSFIESVGGPPNDFRDLPIIPHAHEIVLTEKPYLRAIKTEGAYASVEDYLDTQFRLLREDCLRPLREGIDQYHRVVDKEKRTDLYIYRGVMISLPKTEKQTGQVLHYASLQINQKMRWDKRLKYGSLVCLSRDNFRNNFVFGTVVDRDTLITGEIGLRIDTSVEISQPYNMVESPVFFESYRHVMSALQSYNRGEDIPFSRYLVKVELNTVPPAYLARHEFRINLSKAILMERRHDFPDMTFDVREIHHSLRPDDLGMDVSQFNAFCHTLNTDMSIIQGPPGTGKTFMGLTIAKVLFDNVTMWNPMDNYRPMLVVCYTNHALDQFLEGIAKFLETGIVRVGGRSKNPAMEKYMLHNVRHEHVWTNHDLKVRFYESRDLCRDLAQKIQDVSDKLDRAKRGIFFLEDFSDDDLNLIPESLNGILYIPASLNMRGHDIPVWLEQNSKNPTKKKIDFYLLNLFIHTFSFSEVSAMNMTYYFMEMEVHDLEYFSEFLQNRECENLMKKCVLLPEIAHWPSLSSMNYFVHQGFTPEQAYELLTDPKRSPSEVRVIHDNWKKKDDFPTEELAELVEMMQLNDQAENASYDDIFAAIKVESSKGNENLKIVSKMIRTARPMSRDEVENVNDLWSLPLQDRWRLCRYCLDIRINILTDVASQLEAQLNPEIRKYLELRSLCDVDILKSAKVVGMTTTGAARLQAALRSLRSPIVIVEEAAEVFEAHILSSLTMACEHLILIGDHQQLRPSPACYELEKNYNFNVSLFERMVNNKFPFISLKKQHRMCLDISRTLMPYFYADLEDHESVRELPSVLGMQKNLFFLSHNYPEDSSDEFKSHKNIFEALFSVRLARYFMQQNYEASDVTILCTYLDQMKELKILAKKEFGNDYKIRIESVDNYQGEECNIIILSLVRSNNKENKIGFLSIENRVCVALSRARCGLYIIGNIDFLANNCSNSLWSDIRKRVNDAGFLGNALPIKCQLHGYEQFIAEPLEFSKMSPEGGCLHPCNYRNDCGHMCRMPCHVSKHYGKCLASCPRSCPSKHPCTKLCYQLCGNCMVEVDKVLSCSHFARAPCFKPLDMIKCEVPCTKVLSCGHRCAKKCGDICDPNSCKVKVKKILPNCGHEVEMACYNPPTNYKCKKLVDRSWPICGHTAKIECHRKIDDIPCMKPCDYVLKKCEHPCTGTCGQCRNGRLHIPCESKCMNMLICQHACEGKCCQACPPCKKPCETSCVHSQCGAMSIYGASLKKQLKSEKAKSDNKGRVCGEACPSCAEKCPNICKHRSCSKLCGEVCDVEPCTQPCEKLLPCKTSSNPHYCSGVCGEECIEVCKICHPDKFIEFQEIFFGMEDEENALFIKLKDCNHVFEVSGLDAYITMKVSDGGAVVPIDCPRCRTPIRRSKRYVAILNKNAENIEKIKLKICGATKDEIYLKYFQFKREFPEMAILTGISPLAMKSDWGLCVSLKKVRDQLFQAKINHINTEWFVLAENISKFMMRISEFGLLVRDKFSSCNLKMNWVNEETKFEVLTRYGAVPVDGYLYRDLRDLTDRLYVQRLSDQFSEQFNRELERFHYIFELMHWLHKIGDKLTAEESTILNDVFARLHASNEFNGKLKEELKASFEKMRTLRYVPGYAVSEMELVQIKSALSSHITNWYTCPNGHPYGIGNCGGAMEVSRCPECKEPIGGERHTLVSSNRASNLNERNYSFPPGTRAPF